MAEIKLKENTLDRGICFKSVVEFAGILLIFYYLDDMYTSLKF